MKRHNSSQDVIKSHQICKVHRPHATMSFIQIVLLWFYLGLSPFPVTVANEGLGWDSLLKMVHNPGGDEPASWEGGTTQVLSATSWQLDLL